MGASRTSRLLLVVGATVLGACGGDNGEPSDQGASAESTSTTGDFSHLEKCDDYFGDGVILRAAEAFDLAGCVTADGGPAFYNPTSEDCVDGRTLYWSTDAGWGYDGEPWHADASAPPAGELATCRG